MRPARREPRFTGREVLDIVLNGESDEDIDIGDSESEEEEGCVEESNDTEFQMPTPTIEDTGTPANSEAPRNYQWAVQIQIFLVHL